MWYHAISLCYVCIRSSGIILTPRLPLCKILSFAASVAELAMEKNHVLNRSLILSLTSSFDAPATEAFASKNQNSGRSDSVIFVNENENENGEKWENNEFVNEN